ncbi:ceramide synthase 1 LOH3-like isoform X12 [Quercus robur]|uniref:ceramide synthase 1 LOH3-like isoform X12 n=1 Tax=Quercus robur TaxID=38942 RepID=UPI002163051B|nr:ceramide synthase 1 LOH3-like isoform X12 [Quercus robur]
MGVLNSTSSINWEQESYPMPKDLVLVPLFALFFLSLRLFLDRYVFENLARRLIFGKNHAVLDVSTDVKRKKINKFKESAWKFIYYLSEELLALSVTYDEPWFTNTKYFWVGPGDQVWPDLKIKFARVGSVILAVHEGTDVILEVAKMSKYSGFEGMASICFITFVLCWTVLRLIYYPFWIIWSTSYEVLLTLDMEKHMIDGSIYYYLFNTLLFCLLIIHIYWWKLMVIMVVNQIHARGQISDDVRSDSESDTEHND